MRRLILVFTFWAIFMIPGQAVASNYYHTLNIQVEGEYTFKVNSTLPESNLSLDFSGTGKAQIASDVRILTQDLEGLMKWWDLF